MDVKPENFGISEAVRVLKRRRWIALFTFAAVFLVVFLVYDSQHPIFRASASLEFRPGRSLDNEGDEESWLTSSYTLEQAAADAAGRDCLLSALRSSGIHAGLDTPALENLIPFHKERISTRLDRNATLLTLDVSSSDRESAVLLANALLEYLHAFALRQESHADSVLLSELRNRVNEAEEALDELDNVWSSLASHAPSRWEEKAQRRNLLSTRRIQLQEDIHGLELALSDSGSPPSKNLTRLGRDREKLVRARTVALENFTNSHPEVLRLDDELAALEARIEVEASTGREKSRRAAEERLKGLREEAVRLDEELNRLDRDLRELPEKNAEQSSLKRRRDLALDNLEAARATLAKAEMGLRARGSRYLIRARADSADKIFPERYAPYKAGFAAAVICSLAAAFLWEILDTSFRSVNEVEDALGLPVLGIVPSIVFEPAPEAPSRAPGRPQPGTAATILHFQPRHPVSEAFRSIGAGIEFAFLDEGRKSLMISSAAPAEGKTTTAVNVAIALAHAGRKVLLLDANLRHPSISDLFHLPGHIGLSEALRGLLPCQSGTYQSIVANLDILPAGEPVDNPVELLTASFRDILAKLESLYDIVIIDAPAALSLADSLVLAGTADGVILVYCPGQTSADALKLAREEFERGHCNLEGVVLNKVKREGELGQFYHSYYYSYSPKRESKPKRRKRSSM